MTASVTLLTNGPLMVKGEVEVVDAHGKAVPVSSDTMYSCRRGASANKPFCDGGHKKTGFKS